MLNCVFIGTKNEFDENLIFWLSQRTNLQGVVWPSSTSWRKSSSGKLKFIKKRIKRYGLMKVLDESIFYLVYHKLYAKKDYLKLKKDVILPYRESNFELWDGNQLFSENLNDHKTIEFIRNCEPDIIFAMCINDYFGKQLLNIPKYGVYLWHEGITPEYRGLYSPFWAIHNLDFKNIGYTLLKMNQKIDAGEIYVQGRLNEFDPFKDQHGYIGHKAIWNSLDEVEQFLIDLQNEEAKPIVKQDSKDGYYTYPGITDFLRQRYRLAKLAKSNS